MSTAPFLVEPAYSLFEVDDLPEEFRWVEMLTSRNARVFYGEMYSAALAGASSLELDELVAEWRATAELDADPGLLAKIERNRAKHFLTEEEWRAEQRRTA